MKRISMLLVSAILLGAGIAAAQPAADLPARSFQRFGTAKMRHGSRILCLAYSPDGQTLAAGGGNDPVRLWNPKTGDTIRELSEPGVLALAFSTSGETLLYGGYHKSVRLWNFKQNKEVGRLEGHKAAVKAIAISPDAALIASGSQDGAICLWDMNNKRKVADLPGHTDEVTALAFFADKETSILASAGSDRAIVLWNTETNQTIRRIDAGCAVQALAVSADGTTLYSAGDDYLIRRWDIATGKQTGAFKGHEGTVVSLAIRGDSIVSGSLDRTIRVWDAKSTNQLRLLPRSQGDCDALALTKAGDFLATAGLNNTIRIFDAANGKEIVHAPGLQAGLTGALLSKDNKRLAGVTADGQIVLWDAQAGKLIRQWDSKQTGEIQLAFASDNKTLATASTNVRLWNADTGVELAELTIKDVGPIVALAFSPDSKTLVVGLRSGPIELWSINEKKNVGTLTYPGALNAVAWSPDGKNLAAAGNAKIFVWNPQTNGLVKAFDVKEGQPSAFPSVASLAFGPDSKSLAAGCFDASIRIYRLDSKNPTDAKEHRLCEGHLNSVYSLAFSADGRSLVSGSFDKTVRVWEAFSGKQVALFKGHLGEVTGVAFVNDGRSVFSGSADTTVYQWDIPALQGNGKLPELTLAFEELESAWASLASEETPRGHEMMWRCIASSKQAVPHLTKRLYTVDPERVKKLFRDLDSKHYPTRLAAQKELEGYGRWMEGRYDTAMVSASSLEYKRRLEILKEKANAVNAPSLAQERLRVRRIMLMCEQTGSPEAVEALRSLANRGPEEELREEAQASLQRMGKK